MEGNLKSMKLLIWGIGQATLETVKEVSNDDIIGYIDTYSDKVEYASKRVYKPWEVMNLSYDAILVATVFGESVKRTCQEYGILLDKVIFTKGNMLLQDLNKDYAFVEKICGTQFADFIRNQYHLVRSIEINSSTPSKEFEIMNYQQEKYVKQDYVRLKTFELLVDEINRNSVKGQIAELGVFRGSFAQFLNIAFPQRKLYLFDTFDGFEENELKKELNGAVMEATRDSYKNTSISIVMGKMRFKNNVVIKQGFFPDSLNGLEEEFAFVSLDCDWEESLYQGLKYFYPRLNPGGYIMIHDYNNYLNCAKKSIHRYEREINTIIPKVPICDNQGSLVLTK